MIELTGSVWDLMRSADAVVVPTNIGWKRDGSAVMGKGVALQAASRYPDLQRWYGGHCMQQRTKTHIVIQPFRSRQGHVHNLALFPTKSLNSKEPWLSWQQPSDPGLIRRGLLELRYYQQMASRFLLPLLGAGAGGLDPKLVFDMMRTLLPEDKFILVRLPQ